MTGNRRESPSGKTALMHELVVETAARTHRGRVRADNEDRHLVKRLGPQRLVLAVADGLGGAPGGSEASWQTG
ncbi:MAG: hypothetical protein HF981_10770 [Desulfobacteraceae bacterium]|nr:hypothetical protein [Desulfobacteraceae bacterium]MBC2750856.1 hypothetical protein [Desulfobacteraceae bacterium]